MRLFYFISMMFFFCFMVSSAMGRKNITNDQSALLAFKACVIDPRGVLMYNWSISYPVCSWVGISCSARHHRVTTLDLSNMSLYGTISPHLGNLSFLMYLKFSHNNFYGHLPNELGQLRRLKFLIFSDNKLRSFPSWIGILVKIQVLILDTNNFTGPLPVSLFNLSSLEILSLSYNIIDGNIPSKIGNLSKLTVLYLGANNLKGEIPKEIGSLQNLQSLDIGVNNFNGLIPPTIFNLSSLTHIGLEKSNLTGNLPSTLGNSLPNLENLILWGNQLTGIIPNSITNASKLIGLQLSSNSFSGHIPNTFGNLRFLNTLFLKNNSLTTEDWSFLPSLTNCRNLAFLSLASNPLGRILPPLIGNFSSSLLHFFAYDCKLKGTIPQEIGNLRSLIILSLFDNEFNGIIPTTLGRLKQLQALDLGGNNLQGSIPYDLCHLERLYVLQLSENKLSGDIPQCLASLRSLRRLYLGSNKLTSGIPSSLWSLEYILYISLSSNSLSGSLSSNIQNLKVLIELDLSRNQLSGNIPITMGDLKDLTVLSLAGNQFQGPIPETFRSLTSLESLDLSSNNLSEQIPRSLESLLYLKQLNVSHNRLEGQIPINGPFSNFSAQSFISNYALCGPARLQVPSCKDKNRKRSKKAALHVLKYVFPSLISIGLMVAIVIVFIRRRNRSKKNSALEDLLPLAAWRRTSYLDIQRATDGFNDSNLLGTGSFGSVYKGTLIDGTNVAIKVFNLQLERAFRSFDVECEVLRNVRHRNLVKILSSCCNIDFKALVLEFMPNGSLQKWLYSHNYFLDIIERLNIMIDVGLALEYLHHGHSPPVIHCDLKPSNILLDENMMAHVSDFGISKLLDERDDSVTRTITIATIGYMAPEYGLEGIVSSRCDVYSFGILLLETFTRKKPTDEMFVQEMSLKNWIKESLPHGLNKVIDANLLQEEEIFSTKMDCLLSIMHLALDCCMESPDKRICMTDVVAKLKKIKLKFLADVSVTK